MTVYKTMTGKDGPLLHLEMVLWNSYHKAEARFKQQQEKANKSKGKRR